MQQSTHCATTSLSLPACLSLLDSKACGHLGVIVAGRPEIYPVNHIVYEGDVVFRTGPGTKLDAVRDQVVAYQVDGFDESGTSAWSVHLTGTATEIVQFHAVLDLLHEPLVPWEPGAKPHVVRIHADRITGVQFPLPRATVPGSPERGEP